MLSNRTSSNLQTEMTSAHPLYHLYWVPHVLQDTKRRRGQVNKMTLNSWHIINMWISNFGPKLNLTNLDELALALLITLFIAQAEPSWTKLKFDQIVCTGSRVRPLTGRNGPMYFCMGPTPAC